MKLHVSDYVPASSSRNAANREDGFARRRGSVSEHWEPGGMSSDVTIDDPEAPTGPQYIVPPEPEGWSRTRIALVSAVISAIVTGAVAALLSYPASCDTRQAPFMTDCVNVAGWSAFADYPNTALILSAIAAAAAGLLVYTMVRFSDS